MRVSKFLAGSLFLAALTVGFASCKKEEPKDPFNNGGNNNGEEPFVPTSDTLTVSQACAYLATLSADVESEKAYYVKGTVSENSTTEETITGYGNMTFKMTEGEDVFTAFQVYYLNGDKFTSVDQIKVGDEVIVYGKIVNYKGNTPETVGKGAAHVCYHNGTVDAPVDETIYDVTVAEFNEKEVTNTKFYRLRGTVGGTINTQYGNFDLTDATGTVYVYGTSNAEEYASRLKVGAIVTFVGNRGEFTNTSTGETKIEVLNGYIESLEDAPVVEIIDATVAEFNAAEVSTSVMYRLSGTVGGTINTKYGNFDLTDETGTVYVYGTSNATEYASRLKAGATVVFVGYRGEYTDTSTGETKIEVLNGYIESLEDAPEVVIEGTLLYTLDTTDDANKGKDSSYAGSENITINGITWNVTGNTQQQPWRIGGKNLDAVDREVYTTTPYDKALTNVVVTLGTKNITLNSCKLLYSTNADFTGATEVPFDYTEGAIVLTNSYPANCYYKLVFNCTETSGSNKYVQLSKIEFYGE